MLTLAHDGNRVWFPCCVFADRAIVAEVDHVIAHVQNGLVTCRHTYPDRSMDMSVHLS